MMRVVAFTKTSDIGPSSRCRFGQMRALLAQQQVSLATRPLFGRTYFLLGRVRPAALRILLKCLYVPGRFLARLVELRAARGAHLVVVEHQLFPYLPDLGERLLRRSATPWILEFDDAIYLTRFHRAKIARLCRLADRVVVGNRFLAEFAARHNAAVAVVPTTVDLARFTPRRPRAPAAGAPLVVGWIGLPYNFPALALLEAPLRELAVEVPLVLRVVSAGRPRLAGVPLEAVAWSLQGEAEQIARFDVGVMPLPDDEWSRGKCGLKILQCFAAGVPVVASPVGVNAELIEHGRNGLLASSAADWQRHLRALARDPELRARLGQEGRRTVEAGYSASAWAPRIAGLWQEVARRGAAGGKRWRGGSA